MKTKLAIVAVAAGAIVAVALPVMAHHSFGAEFDSEVSTLLPLPVDCQIKRSLFGEIHTLGQFNMLWSQTL